MSLFCVASLMLNMMIQVNAVDAEESLYVEKTGEICFDNIDIVVKDNEELIPVVSSEANFIQRYSAEKEMNELNSYLANYPETEAALVSQFNSGELTAFSYTETPLTQVDDHYERVLTASYKQKEGAPSTHTNFSLVTGVMRSSGTNSLGEYTYTMITVGEWSDFSVFGGSKYPASGWDYVIQTGVTDFVLDTHNVVVQYTDGEYGEPGTHSYPQDGEDDYIRYAVKDDPFGMKQMQGFSLISTYMGKPANRSRTVHSSYVHTWLSLEIEVSVEANVDSMNGLGAGISITPTIKNCSWPLFSNVTFDF